MENALIVSADVIPDWLIAFGLVVATVGELAALRWAYTLAEVEISFRRWLLTWPVALLHVLRAPQIELTPEERAKLAEERRIAALRAANAKEEAERLKEIERVAKDMVPVIISSLVRQRFGVPISQNGAVVKMKKPEIRNVLVTPDALYFRIDSMPFGKRKIDLLEDPTIARELSLDLQRECRFQSETDLGTWLEVGLKSGLAAIPRFFPWHSEKTEINALDQIPKSRPWGVVMGATTNRRLIIEDARDWPHLLVAGATGGGKSVFLNQMLCTLLLHNHPGRLKVVLIDLKGGLEFNRYREIPHLWRPMIYQREEVPATLQAIIAEKERRFQLFRNAGVLDLKGWNATANRNHKLPRLFVIFDEIANLTLDSTLKKSVDQLMGDVAAQGRALGLHLILCTQVPNKSVLTRLVLSNVTARVGFNTDMAGSMLILGNSRLSHIPPEGRMVYKHANTVVECQAPMITEKQVEQTIQKITGELDEEEGQEVTPDDLFKMSVLNLQGNFARRLLYDQFGGAASQAFIRDVASRYEYDFQAKGPVIQVEGDNYILGQVGRGRRLIPVNGHRPATKEELDHLVVNGS